jgi:hypothetical protein
MGQTNDKRVSRRPDQLPDYSRDDTVKAALDALFEEDIGLGYSEVSYISNVFPTKFETWVDNTKAIKRTEIDFTYGPIPFVTQVVKQYFNDTGSAVNYIQTVTITYNANKTVNTITVDGQKVGGP